MKASFLLIIAAFAGFCTMSYEVLWFRILKYFVDTSIYSFGIMLTTFLFGLTAGSVFFSRIIDSKKDSYFLLGLMEIGIGIFSLISIPLIFQSNNLIIELNRVLGTNWGQEIFIRFLVFSIVMLIPTLLAGGAFPVFTKIYSVQSNAIGKSIGNVFAFNTLGGAFGSFAGGFILIPFVGVQNSIFAISLVNAIIGLVCVCIGSTIERRLKILLSTVAFLSVGFVLWIIPQNSFVNIYRAKYPAPENDMLYCKEAINGTTTVFQNARQNLQRYMLIDGIGEVSTDYFSMRAFRFLGILPILYMPDAHNALVVTFGSGIVAGAITTSPGIEQVDCVEICDKAFEAAKYFNYDNHDVLNNPKIHFIVNDGRNFVFTTKKRYDLISADATHPTSGDSWVLYTEEFYKLCKSKLTDKGIMCQWIPLHGIVERDYKVLLKTFHEAFPYAAVYYSGGRKNTGHTVLLGSKMPLRIDFTKAQKLLQDNQIKEDLGQVNITSVYDVFNSFVTDQDGIVEYAGTVPISTDDKPEILFSKIDSHNEPCVGLISIAKFRKNIFPQLFDLDSGNVVAVKQTIDTDFESMGYSMNAQNMEFEEYMLRMKQNFDKSYGETLQNLYASKTIIENAISQYEKALTVNSNDGHTKYMLGHLMFEYNKLMSYLATTTVP